MTNSLANAIENQASKPQQCCKSWKKERQTTPAFNSTSQYGPSVQNGHGQGRLTVAARSISHFRALLF